MNTGLTVSQIRALVTAGELTEIEGQEMIAARVAKLTPAASAAAAAPTTGKKPKKESVVAPPSEKKSAKKESKPTAKKEDKPKREKIERPSLPIDGAEEVSKYCPREIAFCGMYGPNQDCYGFKLGKHFLCYDGPTWEHLIAGPFSGSDFARFVAEYIAY